MRARLDTVPKDKFPRLYEALQKKNRIDAFFAGLITACRYLALMAFGGLIAFTLTYGFSLLSLTGGAQ